MLQRPVVILERLHVGKRSRLYLASAPGLEDRTSHLRDKVVIKRGNDVSNSVREFDILHNYLGDCRSVSKLDFHRLLHDDEIDWGMVDRFGARPHNTVGESGFAEARRRIGDLGSAQPHPCNAVLRYERSQPGLAPFGQRACMADARAARLLAPAFMCVADLHLNSRVVHCDVKPDNFVRISEQEMVLVDFDCATVLPKTGDVAYGKRGTPLYMSPEMMRYGEMQRSCDAWALGIILYATCNGLFHPYATADADFARLPLKDFMRVSVNADYNDDMWLNTDAPAARDLCRLLLCEDTEERVDVCEALNHPFFRDY